MRVQGRVAGSICAYRAGGISNITIPRWIEPKTIVRPKRADSGFGGFTCWVDEEVVIPGEFQFWGVDSKTSPMAGDDFLWRPA